MRGGVRTSLLAPTPFLWARQATRCKVMHSLLLPHSSFRRFGSARTLRDDAKQESKQDRQGAGGDYGSGGNGEKRGPWETYCYWLATYPLATKTVTSAVIVASGDAFAQVNIEGAGWENFAWRRLANMFIVGGCVIGPCLHFWYGILYRFFPSPTSMGALQRLALDQFLFAPPFIPAFMGVVFALEGRLKDLPGHMEQNFTDMCLTNWSLWIPAQYVTFRYIPHNFQVLFVNGVAFIWNTYLSYVGHKHQEQQGLQ